jgi:AcrR family transcriptional regulator
MTVARAMAGRSGTRPKSAARARELALAAAEQFYRLGFYHVTLAEVAAAVGVTAPAVYRHYRNKQALLAGAIISGIDVADAAMDAAEDRSLDELTNLLAEAALSRRDVWVLLQRELRHLDGDARTAVLTRFRRMVARFTGWVAAERPAVTSDELALLVTAALAVLASPSVNRVTLARTDYQRLLGSAAAAACRATLPPAAGSATARPEAVSDASQVRGEQLLDAAIQLFHQRGYSAVSLDDIGAEAGMAGPSIYYHFATKADLLVTAFSRAADRLSATRPGTSGTLDDLVRHYAEFAVQERELFDVYVLESINLPPEAGRRISSALRAEVNEWVAALRRERPALSEPQCRVLVHAARAVVQDVVRIGQLHARTGISAEIQALAHAVLATDVGASRSRTVRIA